jgi:hypothetical protein
MREGGEEGGTYLRSSCFFVYKPLQGVDGSDGSVFLLDH